MGSVMSGIGNVLGSVVGGPVGGLSKGFSEAAGTQSQYQAGMPGIYQQNFQPGLSQSASGFNQNINSQNELAQALMAQSRGEGPNPALLQLQQTTGQNMANANAMAAGARGVNPALAMRLAQQNAAMQNQQSAGQAALMSAQQQLGAQGQLAGLYSNIGQQQLGMQGALQQGQSAQNNAITQGSIGIQGSNQNTAAANAAQNAAIAGGVLEGISGAAAGAGGGGKGKAAGGRIDGKAEVKGDSPRNDKVPAMLSPGEVVIPRTKANDPDKAREFVAHLMKSEGKEVEDGKGYGKILEAQRKLEAKVKELEKKLKKKD